MIRQTFLNINVVEATRKRIEWIFDHFNNIVVSISGGKDSTVMAVMALQEAHKRNRKIGIFFLDEEVVYQSTIDQVRYLMELYPENTIKMWYQLEFNLTNATSMDETQFKVWDKDKEEWYFSVVDVCQVLTQVDLHEPFGGVVSVNILGAFYLVVEPSEQVVKFLEGDSFGE